MKPVKMLGLAALLSLMAMAFVDTSSAIAESTALCKKDAGANVCPEGQLITHVHEATSSSNKAKLLTALDSSLGQHVHEATSSGSKARLLSSVVSIECDALFLGEVTSSTPLTFLGHFTYSNCNTSGGTKCSVTETGEDATVYASKLGHELADTTYAFKLNFKCGFLINCTYNGEGLGGHALGPLLAAQENGEVRIEEQTLKKAGGSFCPETAKLDFLATPLIPSYIAEGSGETESTVLCNEDPGSGESADCGRVERTIECDILFLGNVTSKSNLASPLVITGNFTYTNCETDYKSKCEVKETSGNAAINVEWLGHELADQTYVLEANFHCGFLINCTYDGEGLGGHALGPLLAAQENGEVRIEEHVTHRISGSLCPEIAELDLLTTPLESTYITQ
jgi:hypothetical protein